MCVGLKSKITSWAFGDWITKGTCAWVDAGKAWISQIGSILADGCSGGRNQENTANTKSVQNLTS